MDKFYKWGSARLNSGTISIVVICKRSTDSVKATAKLFADDTKLYTNISTLADCEALQDDLKKLAV